MLNTTSTFAADALDPPEYRHQPDFPDLADLSDQPDLPASTRFSVSARFTGPRRSLALPGLEAAATPQKTLVPEPVKLLSLARDLQRRKARERNQQFVAEGVRSVESLLNSPLRVTGILAAASQAADIRRQAILARAEQVNIPILRVSDAEFASSASTDTPQGVLAIAEIPTHQLAPPARGARYLVLDGIQDPGNVGTIIRSAAAFGVDVTMCLPGTVDVWNAKVVRSAMGALFSAVVVTVLASELAEFFQSHKVSCWAADTEGTSLYELALSAPERLALVVSNEGAGLSPEAATLATQRVAIAMAPGVESLNVAVATSILLHALQYVRRAPVAAP